MSVRLADQELGTVADVALNGRLDHVLGLDVVHGGGHTFVPWTFVRISPGHLAVTTPAALDPLTALNRILSAGPRLSEVIFRGCSRVGRTGAIRYGNTP